MRYFSIMLIILFSATLQVGAQTTSGTTGGQKRTQINKQEKKRLQRGTSQYYGKKDTTPGSPMGTGGAGGDMSGSPAASAIETDDQTSKADVNKDSINAAGNTNMNDTTQQKPGIKKAGSGRHKSRNL